MRDRIVNKVVPEEFKNQISIELTLQYVDPSRSLVSQNADEIFILNGVFYFRFFV